MTRHPAMSPTDRVVASRLREARRLTGLTQLAVGKEIGLSNCAVSQHETGWHKVSVAQLVRYSEIYGCSISWLVGHSLVTGPAIVTEHAGRDLLGVYQEDGGDRRQLGLLRRVRRRAPALWRPDPALAAVLGIDLRSAGSGDIHLTEFRWRARIEHAVAGGASA